MNVLSLVQPAVTLLVLTALGGITMATLRTRHVALPHWLGTAHGYLAAAALTLLLTAALSSGFSSLGWTGLVLLLTAACGVVLLNLWYQFRGMELPRGLKLTLATAAAAGLAAVIAGQG